MMKLEYTNEEIEVIQAVLISCAIMAKDIGNMRAYASTIEDVKAGDIDYADACIIYGALIHAVPILAPERAKSDLIQFALPALIKTRAAIKDYIGT